MEKYIKIFKALGDKTRLRIVMMLKVKPMCVCEIREIIGSSMSTISNHLKILKEAGILSSDKEDKFINYKLDYSQFFIGMLLKLLDYINSELVKVDRKKVLKTNRENIC